MRCANRPLYWLVGLAVLALATAAAHATEAAGDASAEPGGTNPDASAQPAGTNPTEEAATTEQPAAGPLEGTVETPGTKEELLGEGFDAGNQAIGLEEGRVNFALQGANVRDFCNWFAERLNINIVLSPKVDGPMNITLHNVPWEIALKKALETHGYVLTLDENGIYTVLTKEEVALEPLATHVYTLSYARAETAAAIIKPLLSERGIIQFDTDGNQLIILDVPAQFADIEKVIAKLDQQTAQVLIEVKLIEKTSSNAKDVGFKWASLENYALTASSIKRNYQHQKTRTDRDLIYTDEAWSQHLEPHQTPETRTITGQRVTGDPDLATPLEETIKTTTKTLILSASDLQIVLSALLRDDNTELISNPKIATVDNREAEINVTRDIPIPNYTYNEQTGSYEISDFSYKQVGIKLKITPQVNQDDYITLDVLPELSTEYDSQVFVISGSEVTIPIVDTRKAATRVIVKSSETLVIGGLTSTDETSNVTRVPVLSRIPVVGNLFKHKSTEKVKTDLLIFITPTLVTGGGDEGALLFPEKGTDIRQAATERPASSHGTVSTKAAD
jgi:type IV pilus secretin PilQ/predicted competence protein